MLFVQGYLSFTDGRFSRLAGETYNWFLVVFFATHAALIALGGILSWLAYSPKRKWASWCFIAFCIWRAGDAVWSNIRFANDESGANWLRLIVFPTVWILLAMFEWMRKTNAKSFNVESKK